MAGASLPAAGADAGAAERGRDPGRAGAATACDCRQSNGRRSRPEPSQPARTCAWSSSSSSVTSMTRRRPVALPTCVSSAATPSWSATTTGWCADLAGTDDIDRRRIPGGRHQKPPRWPADSRRASSSAWPHPRTRSRAPPTRMAAANRSGTPSVTRRGGPGTGETGDVACDHYHRWQDDIALMRELGIGSYRFSVSWSRVLPDGIGAVNQPGLDFYDHLVDGLLAAGHHATADPLPLGPAAGALRPRWLDQSGGARLVRRVRGRHGHAARRPRAALADTERAAGLRVHGPRLRPPCAGHGGLADRPARRRWGIARPCSRRGADPRQRWRGRRSGSR